MSSTCLQSVRWLCLAALIAVGSLATSPVASAAQSLAKPPPPPLTLSPNPASVGEGLSVTLKVTLPAKAGNGGAVIALSSTNNAIATVPQSVTVPKGQFSATFPVTGIDDGVVGAPRNATITAANASYTAATDVVTVTNTTPLTLTLSVPSPTLAETGTTSTGGTVSRNGTLGDLQVALSSSDTSEANVPAMVTIPSGSTTAPFTVTAVDDGVPDGPQTSSIGASVGTVSALPVAVTVQDTSTWSFGVPSSLSEGQSATVTVTRSSIGAESLTFTVAVGSGLSASAPTVTIDPGSDTTSFTLTAIDNTIVDGNRVRGVTLTQVGGLKQATTKTLTIVDNDVPLAIVLSPTEVAEGSPFTVTLHRSDASTAVSYNLFATAPVKLPLVSLAVGQTDSPAFGVTIPRDDRVTGPYDVTFTATGSDGTQATATLVVDDIDVPTATLSLPTSVPEGGPAQASVFLNFTPPGATTFALSCQDARFPAAQVTVQAGQSFGSANIQLGSDHGVGPDLTVAVALSLVPPVSTNVACVGAATTIVDSDSSFVLSFQPAIVAEADEPGGITGVLTRLDIGTGLPTTAGSAVKVSLLASPSDSRYSLPTTVAMDAGAATVSFPVDLHHDGMYTGDVTVQVVPLAGNNATTSASFTITESDAKPLAVTFADASILEGYDVHLGTVTRPSTVGPLTVSLVASDSELPPGTFLTKQFPTSVVIPDGQSSVDFTYSVFPDGFADDRTVTVEASADGQTTGSGAILVGNTEPRQFSISAANAPEGAAGTSVSVFRNYGMSLPLFVAVTPDAANSDVTLPFMQIAPYSTFGFGTAKFMDNTAINPDRVVTLSASDQLFGQSATCSFVIFDDDTVIALSAPSPVSEKVGTVAVTVSRFDRFGQPASQGPITVQLTKSGDVNANGGYFQTVPDPTWTSAPGPTVVIGDGQSTATIDLPVTYLDTIVAPTLDTLVTLTGSAGPNVPGQAVVDVQEADTLVTFTITSVDANDPYTGQILEGDVLHVVASTVGVVPPSALIVSLSGTQQPLLSKLPGGPQPLDPTVVSLPPSVTIPRGGAVPFDVTTYSDAPNNEGPRLISINGSDTQTPSQGFLSSGFSFILTDAPNG